MTTPVPGNGRHIETPTQFQHDDGSGDQQLLAALDQFATDPTTFAELFSALARARLLVPVVAVLDEADDSGGDKSSHMATVTLVQPDGRRGLLAFTSQESLARWDPTARPVPAMAISVAAASIAEHADGVLIDVAGPTPFVIDGPALQSLAEARGSTSPPGHPEAP
ncbi:MAG: SseB family protein [Actinomycetes bacterium]